MDSRPIWELLELPALFCEACKRPLDTLTPKDGVLCADCFQVLTRAVTNAPRSTIK